MFICLFVFYQFHCCSIRTLRLIEEKKSIATVTAFLMDKLRQRGKKNTIMTYIYIWENESMLHRKKKRFIWIETLDFKWNQTKKKCCSINNAIIFVWLCRIFPFRRLVFTDLHQKKCLTMEDLWIKIEKDEWIPDINALKWFNCSELRRKSGDWIHKFKWFERHNHRRRHRRYFRYWYCCCLCIGQRF